MGLLLLICLTPLASPLAQEASDGTGPSGQPVPRFVSVRADEANLRVGPGRQHPVQWVYVRANLPVEVVGEYDQWRKVRDMDGAEGWMHRTLLSSRRYAIVHSSGRLPLYARKDTKSPVRAWLGKGVQARVSECNGAWCKLVVGDVRGWGEQAMLYGVYPRETVE